MCHGHKKCIPDTIDCVWTHFLCPKIFCVLDKKCVPGTINCVLDVLGLGQCRLRTRVVLCLVDLDPPDQESLKQITRAAFQSGMQLLLAWTEAEAARYLETFRAYARKPADMIKERSDGAFTSLLAECLTIVRPLNKTDVATLHSTFGSLHAMMHASAEELALCPGLGERKVSRLRDAFLEPFVPRRARASMQPAEPSEAADAPAT